MSNDTLARLSGLLYLSTLPTGGLGYFSARPLLELSGSAAVAQLVATRSFLELGVLAGAVCAVTWLVLGALFYELFRTAGERACRLLVVFVVTACVLLLASLAQVMDAMSLATRSQHLELGAEQVRALIAAALQSYDSLSQVSIIFWGLWLVPLGLLVYRSGFVPRALGVLMLFGALAYLASFIAPLLQPGYAKTPLAAVINFVFLLPGTVGELGTALWLLIRGTRSLRASAVR